LMEDDVIIRINRDLQDVLFENGEEPNFRKGDLVRALVEVRGYGVIARVDYGCGQITSLFSGYDDLRGPAFEVVSVLDLVRRATLPPDHPDFYDPDKFF